MEINSRKDLEEDPRQAHAENVAYTVNHALACTAADLASPYVSHTILSKLFHKHSNWSDWLIGEGVGDFAAVPVTIAIENHAPHFVGGVRKVMESSLGWAFRKSAKREANAWARQNAVSDNSAEAREKERQIYRYEMEHLPQAAIWTVTSFAFNVATQKLAHKYLHTSDSQANHGHHDHGHDHHHSHDQPLWAVAGALAGGKLFSTALVVGVRAAFPDKAHEWDNFAGRAVFAPVTRTVTKAVGSDSNWEQRVKREDSPTPPGRSV